MTLREIVKELRLRGHEVTYRNRKDGGILITSIDGIKYRGAAGNTLARAKVGAELSKARAGQLKSIKPKGAVIKEALPKTLKEKLREVQKLYNKNKVPYSQGRITQRLIKRLYKEEGLQAAYEKLQRAEQYASGYATEATIQAFIDHLGQMSALLDPEGQALVTELQADIMLNSDKIRDEDIYPAYDRLYDINKGANVKDVLNDVRNILKISRL